MGVGICSDGVWWSFDSAIAIIVELIEYGPTDIPTYIAGIATKNDLELFIIN